MNQDDKIFVVVCIVWLTVILLFMANDIQKMAIKVDFIDAVIKREIIK